MNNMNFEQFKELLVELDNINNNLDVKYRNAFEQLIRFNSKKNNTNPFQEIISLKNPTQEDFENFKSFLKE